MVINFISRQKRANRLSVIVLSFLLLSAIPSYSQLYVSIDSLRLGISAAELNLDKEIPFEGPYLEICAAITNTSEDDVVLLAYNKRPEMPYCIVDLYIQLAFEYKGVVYYNKTLPIENVVYSAIELNSEGNYLDWPCELLVLQSAETSHGWKMQCFPFTGNNISKMEEIDYNNRIALRDEWDRLYKILEEVVPTIKVLAYPIQVYNCTKAPLLLSCY